MKEIIFDKILVFISDTIIAVLMLAIIGGIIDPRIYVFIALKFGVEYPLCFAVCIIVIFFANLLAYTDNKS